MNNYKKIRLSKTRVVDEHRLVANAQDLGFNVIVHHIDGNKHNNAPENLQVMTRAEHVMIHGGPPENIPTVVPNEDDTFTCRHCGETKWVWDFVKNPRRPYGFDPECKACKRNRQRGVDQR